MNPVGQPPAPPVLTTKSVDISGAMEVLQLQAPALQPQQVDVPMSVTAFYKEQSVIEFMNAVLDIRDIGEQQELLTDSQIDKFTKEIKGLKVEITHNGIIKRRYRVINVTRKSAEIQRFPMKLENGQTVKCTVEKYFLDRYKKKLRYPHLPCLHVGEEYKHTFLPLEVCNIVARQRCLKKFTDLQAMIKIITLNTLPPPMLNHVSRTDFYKAQPVIEFMCEVLGIRAISEQKKLLSDSQRNKFKKEIIGLKIEITHRGPIRKRFIVRNVTERPVFMQFFPLEVENGPDVKCTVSKYFLGKYNMKLHYSHLPCLHVGEEHRQTYLPLEVCNIVAGQQRIKKLTDMQTSTMVKATAPSAPYHEREIHFLIQRADFNNDSYEQEFGPTISNSMMEGKLNVQQTKLLALPNQEVLSKRGKRLFTGVEICNWALVCFAPQNTVCEDTLRNFITHLQTISSDSGMSIIGQPCFCKYATKLDQVEPMFRYLKIKFTGLQLVIVILEGKTSLYDEVKKVGDTVLGIATQCVLAKNVNDILPHTLFNICSKINIKLGGINSIPVPCITPKVRQGNVCEQF